MIGVEMGTLDQKSVHMCPWQSDDGECITTMCAEFGPRYLISPARAREIVKFISAGIGAGFLDSGRRVQISITPDYQAHLCPRAFCEPVARELTKRGDARMSVEVEDEVCVVVVA